MNQRTPQTSIENGSWNVLLDGQITEEYVFPAPPEGIHAAVLDLGGISYINSTGVRSWMIWTQALANRKTPSGQPIKMEIVRAPLSFLRLMELIKEMIPQSSSLRSFFLSFSCLDCGQIQHVEVANQLGATNSQMIEGDQLPTCKDCDSETELEMAPSFYRSLSRFSPDRQS